MPRPKSEVFYENDPDSSFRRNSQSAQGSKIINTSCLVSSIMTALIVGSICFIIGAWHLKEHHSSAGLSNLPQQPSKEVVQGWTEQHCQGNDWTFVPETGSCYLFMEEKKTAEEAEKECQALGGDGDIVELVKEYESGDEIPHLHRLIPESLLNKVGYSFWADTPTPDSSDCPVFGGAGYLWNDFRSNCSEPTEFICREVIFTHGDTKSTYSPSSGAYFWHHNERLDWESARNHCVSSGGDLASIHNMEEKALVDSISVRGAWIGLNDKDKEGEWVWSDGSAVDYTPWYEGEPSGEDCVHIFTDWKWNDIDCDGVRTSVCKF